MLNMCYFLDCAMLIYYVFVFVQTAVVSCSIIVLILFVSDVFHSPVPYYALVIAVAGVFAFPVLTFYFQRDFISWLIQFICRGYEKVFV